MAIFDIKKILGGGIRERPEKKERAPAKDHNPPASSSHPDKSGRAPEKKDTDRTIFGGKSDMPRGSFMYQLTNPEFYSRTGNLEKNDRTRLGETLFGHGSFVKKKEVEEAERQLDLGKWGKFKGLSHEDKEKAKRLTKGILGK